MSIQSGLMFRLIFIAGRIYHIVGHGAAQLHLYMFSRKKLKTRVSPLVYYLFWDLAKVYIHQVLREILKKKTRA